MSLTQALHDAEAAKADLVVAMQAYVDRVRPLFDEVNKLAVELGMIEPAPPAGVTAVQQWAVMDKVDSTTGGARWDNWADANERIGNHRAQQVVTRYSITKVDPDGSSHHAYTKWTTDPKDAS